MATRDRLNQSDADYVRRARFIDNEFPALKKYRGRKRLKPHEKAHIQRLYSIYRIVEIDRVPNEQRPDALKFYVFPGRRLPGYRRRASQKDPNRRGDHGLSDAARARMAKELAEFVPDMKRLSRRKRFTPRERRLIEITARRFRYAFFLKRLSPMQIELLKRQRRASRIMYRPDTPAIKLKGLTEQEERFERLEFYFTSWGMIVRLAYPEKNNIRVWKFVYVGRRGDAQTDALIEAAEKLESEGAKTLRAWTNHGASPQGAPALDALEFAAMIGDESAIEEIESEGGASAKRIVSGGFALAFQQADERRSNAETRADMLADVTWIIGVVGLFERKIDDPPFLWERYALRYAKDTGQRR